MTDGAAPDPESGDEPRRPGGSRAVDGPRAADEPAPGDGPGAFEAADHWVYVLRCADGTLYTGYTTDVERRVAEHDDGDGAKYTRGRTPVELVHAEGFATRSAALSREHEIKTFSRRRKLRLIE